MNILWRGESIINLNRNTPSAFTKFRPNAEAIHSLFVAPTESGIIQFVRYFFVGGVSFLVDFTTLWLLKDGLGFHYLGATAIAFIAGLSVNYLISIKWVFGKRNINNRFFEFIIFAVIGVVGLILTELGMWALTGGLGVHYLLSKVLTTVIVYIWNFGIRKILLFK